MLNFQNKTSFYIVGILTNTCLTGLFFVAVKSFATSSINVHINCLVSRKGQFRGSFILNERLLWLRNLHVLRLITILYAYGIFELFVSASEKQHKSGVLLI